MALTDPTWNSPGGKADEGRRGGDQVRLDQPGRVAGAARRRPPRRAARPPTRRAGRLATTLGFPKRTINAALYASGKTGVPPGSPHTTFPPDDRRGPGLPELRRPVRAEPAVREHPRHHAAAVHRRALGLLPERASSPGSPTTPSMPCRCSARAPSPTRCSPPPSTGAWSSGSRPPCPATRCRSTTATTTTSSRTSARSGPTSAAPTTTSARFADYPGGNLNADPPTRRREPGATSRLNRFIDHYAKPPGNPAQPAPAFDVTGALQVCPAERRRCGARRRAGPRFTASTFAALAPNRADVNARGRADDHQRRRRQPARHERRPGGQPRRQRRRCPVESTPGGLAAGPGVATYDSRPAARATTRCSASTPR